MRTEGSRAASGAPAKEPAASAPKRVGRPRSSKKAASSDPKRDILIAASRLFSAQGYEGTQMHEIAKSAGLKRSSVYYYYPNKESIWRGLSHYTISASDLSPERWEPAGKSSEHLYQLLRDHVQRVTSGPFDLWFQVQTAGRYRSDGGHYPSWQKRISELIERAIDEGDFRKVDVGLALHMIIGAIYGAMEMRHKGLPVDAEAVAQFVIRALRPHSAAEP